MKQDYSNMKYLEGLMPTRVLNHNIDDHVFHSNQDIQDYFKTVMAKYNIEPKYFISSFPKESNKARFPFVDNKTKKIIFDEYFLTYLWIVSYSLFVIYDEYIHKLGLIIHLDSKDSINTKLVGEAWELLLYGDYILKEAPFKYDYCLPNPEKYDDSNQYIRKANLVYLTAFTFIMLHEITHIDLGHIDLPHERSMEFEADENARVLLTQNIKSEEEKTIIGMGLLIANAFPLLITDKIVSDTHPDTDERLRLVLEELDLDESHNLWGVAGLVFIIWSWKYNKKLSDPPTNSTYKDHFYQYLVDLESYK